MQVFRLVNFLSLSYICSHGRAAIHPYLYQCFANQNYKVHRIFPCYASAKHKHNHKMFYSTVSYFLIPLLVANCSDFRLQIQPNCENGGFTTDYSGSNIALRT